MEIEENICYNICVVLETGPVWHGVIHMKGLCILQYTDNRANNTIIKYYLIKIQKFS